MQKNKLLIISLLFLFNLVNLFGVTTGTADGTYDFGTVGAENSGGTGYKTQGDKFIISNDFLSASGVIYLYNQDGTASPPIEILSSTVEWIAEGGSTMKTFTFEDMNVGNYTAITDITVFVVTVKNISGGTIATHTFNGTQSINTDNFPISSFAFTTPWPSGGYDNVSQIEISYTTFAATSNFEFRDITLSNISNTAVSNNAPTAASFSAGTIYEGTTYAFSTANFGYNDLDSDPLDNIRIDAVPANGSLWVDSDGSNTINGTESALANTSTVSKADLDAGYLNYLNTDGTSSSFTFSVSDGTDYCSSIYTATLTVTPFPTVNFTAATQASTNETGTITITAQLSASSDKTVTIPFTVNGSSTAIGNSTDYSITASPLSISSGNTTATITITIVSDALDEENETVVVDMGTPTNATKGTTTTHTATISDDDDAPTVSFSAATQSSTNETGTMSLTAALSGASGKDVTVPFTVNGSSTATGSGTDYTITSSPISISAGSSSADITITIASDELPEQDETVIIDMGTPTNATKGTTTTHTATISDDDVPTVSFTMATQSSTNETGTLTITAELSAVTAQTVTVPFTVNGSSTATGSGTDYSITSSPLSISSGNTSASITITIASDALDEENETVVVDMGTPTNATKGTTGSHTATITDDDDAPTVSFTSATQSSVSETGTMTITAALSGASGKDVTVPFTVNGSSTATGGGTDYTITSSPISISAGSSSADITITIATDALDEDNETVLVDMGTPLNATKGATTTHTATITDDDNAPSLSFAAATQSSVSETGTMIITAALSGASGKDVTVPFTVNGSSTATGSGTDYTITSSPVVISAGASSATLTLTIATDALDEDNETVLVDMGTPTNATQGATTTHTATITDDDNTPVVTALQSFTIDEHSTGIIGTVAASDADVGTSYQNWTITSNTNSDGDGNNAFIINLTTGQLSVNDADDLDRESIDKLTISVTVSDGTNTSSEENVTINLNDVNDVLPVISASQEFSVPDNKAAGEPIDTVLATDGDITATTFQNWTIVTNVNTDLDGNNAFSIDASTGAIKVNDEGDLISGNSHNVGIIVSDGVNSSIEAVVVINVTASNHNPVITSTNTFSVEENSTAISTITASDEDSDIIEFMISGGFDDGLFDINSTSGVLTFNEGVNFEMPSDANNDNDYEVEVTAIDNKTGSVSQQITVTVTNINDIPVIENQAFLVNENSIDGTVIDLIVALDEDAGQTLSYEITSGNSEEYFAINSSTGVLSVNDVAGLDYEQNNSFDIVINVSDDAVVSLSANATVTVNIVDVNEAPVIIDQTFTVNENSQNETSVGIVTATDIENMTLTYSIDGDDLTIPFVLNSTTGEVTVTDPSMLDYELEQSFTFNVSAADTSLSATAEITVNLNNINDNAPMLLADTFAVSEDASFGAVVDTIKVYDADGAVGTYSVEIISGNEGDIFSIDPSIMKIIVNNPDSIDYESKESYTIEISLHDGIHVVDTALIVNVIDVIETGIVTIFSENISVYPIPANDKLVVSCSNECINTITIVDLNGRLINSVNFNNKFGNCQFDVSNLLPGNYILIIKTDKRDYQKNIVVN